MAEEPDALTHKSRVRAHAPRRLLASELVGPLIAHRLERTDGMAGWWFTPKAPEQTRDDDVLFELREMRRPTAHRTRATC